MTIWDKIKYQFNKNDSPIRKLIILNIAVFIAVALFKMVANLYQADDQAGVVLNYLNLSPRVGEIISRPWTIITHMFMHAGLMHILGNMLLLYFMGRIFEDFVSKKTVYAVYFGGGLLGAFISVLFTNIFPVLSGTLNSGYMLGASACVTSIVAAAAILVPNYEVYLFGAFRLKIKWIAIYVIALDILLFTEGNQGGKLAHLGGAIWGLLYVMQMRDTLGLNLSFLNNIRNPFKPKYQVIDERNIIRKQKVTKPKTTVSNQVRHGTEHSSGYDSSNSSKPDQHEIDAILDKINQSGYDSLTKQEKELLFRASE